jgi:hypothetical protein
MRYLITGGAPFIRRALSSEIITIFDDPERRCFARVGAVLNALVALSDDPEGDRRACSICVAFSCRSGSGNAKTGNVRVPRSYGYEGGNN